MDSGHNTGHHSFHRCNTENTENKSKLNEQYYIKQAKENRTVKDAMSKMKRQPLNGRIWIYTHTHI